MRVLDDYGVYRDIVDHNKFIVIPRVKHTYLSIQYILQPELDDDLPMIENYIRKRFKLSKDKYEMYVETRRTMKTLITMIDITFKEATE